MQPNMWLGWRSFSRIHCSSLHYNFVGKFVDRLLFADFSGGFRFFDPTLICANEFTYTRTEHGTECVDWRASRHGKLWKPQFSYNFRTIFVVTISVVTTKTVRSLFARRDWFKTIRMRRLPHCLTNAKITMIMFSIKWLQKCALQSLASLIRYQMYAKIP